MTDIQTFTDRVEIEALRGEFTDAAMMLDHNRFASLFTQEAVLRIQLDGDTTPLTGSAPHRTLLP
jgi:hypothetical protein